MASSPQTQTWSKGQFVTNDASSPLPREALSTVLADMIARMKGVDPTDNGFRLYEYMDPEAIDAIYEHSRRWGNAEWRLEFDTGEMSVVVRSDGFIRVRRTPETTTS